MTYRAWQASLKAVGDGLVQTSRYKPIIGFNYSTMQPISVDSEVQRVVDNVGKLITAYFLHLTNT